MMLYVDDQRPCPPGWKLAKTIDEAIRILADSLIAGVVDPVEVVSLDHDISYNLNLKPSNDGELWEAKIVDDEEAIAHLSSPETFQPVARYLALMPPTIRPEVRFHTANPVGEAKMREILEQEVPV